MLRYLNYKIYCGLYIFCLINCSKLFLIYQLIILPHARCLMALAIIRFHLTREAAYVWMSSLITKSYLVPR